MSNGKHEREKHEVIRDAIERALRSETADWKDAAIKAVLEAASRYTTFIADDVWRVAVEQGTDLLATSQCGRPGSSLGGLLGRLKKAELIETTGDFRYSDRIKAHGKPLPVWRKGPAQIEPDKA